MIKKEETNMREGLRWLSLGAALLATGCTMKNASVPPDRLMAEFQAGQPILDCRADCALAWSNNRQNVANMDLTGRWRDLALLVMQIGYEDDLAYYYLGRAAENLGYLQAAQRYYRTAEKLSVTDMSCRHGELQAQAVLGIPVSQCGGYSFPDVLYPHLAVVEQELAAQSAPEPSTTHRARKRVVHKPAPATAASANAGGSFAVPAPSAAPAGGSGFVEPAAAAGGGGFAVPPPASR
jgi:hypothetical protein